MSRIRKVSIGLAVVMVFQVVFGMAFMSRARAATLTVAKDGSGSYKTVQSAINAAKSGDTIQIKDGTYSEQITITTSNIKLIGQSKTGTIITASNYQEAAGSAEKAATANISASNFYAENITFVNAFNGNSTSSNQDQAQALFSRGDKQVYANCAFKGHQDTIYNYSGRQYFYNCYVEGDVDFIYGPATVVFDKCEIYSISRGSSSNNGYITAPATQAGVTYGYLFYKCKLTGNCAAKTVKLGRAWKNEPKALFRECELGAHIADVAWIKMSTTSPDPANLDMFEYKNTGPGSNTSRKQLNPSREANYTMDKYLAGSDNWNPIINGTVSTPTPTVRITNTSTPTNIPTNTPTNTPIELKTPTDTPVPTPKSIEDLNGDGAINMSDIMLIASAFNSVSGSAAYKIKYDLDKNGAINMVDVMIVAAKFNTFVQ